MTKKKKRKTKKSVTQAQKLLTYLNKEYSKLHTAYEDFYWISYMGDHSVNKKMNEAREVRDAFNANRELSKKVNVALKTANKKDKEKLKAWKLFFSKYQTPEEFLDLKSKIDNLESAVFKSRLTRIEGYKDPKTKKFKRSSFVEMRVLMMTHKDEKVRKACFYAIDKLATGFIKEYIEIVKLRNEYARGVGYEDFYDYKIQTEEGMSKKETFDIFDKIFEKTKYAFRDVREMEKGMPGLRKPWNFSYMMTGDFAKEEDPYFQFDEALTRWGRSFEALGIDYRNGALKLDLLDRRGKQNNGFCHYPQTVQYKNGKRTPGSANFTCNVVFGQVGSGIAGMKTLFHEGGHAAHHLNSTQTEVCLNTEWPPASTAWAETQSMFLDSVFSSIEWKVRYAKNKDGNAYPRELFERKLKKIYKMRPLSMMSIIFVMNFEKKIYEAKKLTVDIVKKIAREMDKKYFNRSEDSLFALNIPHIYKWDTACYYHGYGLAEITFYQWRENFYKKYGYIVDNPRIGKEMTKVWKLGSSNTFKEFVKIATGKKLSSGAYIKSVSMSLEKILARAQQRIERMKRVPKYKKKIKLNAKISMVHGKKEIANNKKGFEAMAEKYKKWLNKNQRIKS